MKVELISTLSTINYLLLLSTRLKKMLFTRMHYFFSKNYSSTFKVRARLAEFFKHVHPDQMHQAPTKIKDENMRSLKNFNAYIDSINQEKPIEGKLLKFYIAEKTNNKSKRFFSFTLELPQITADKAIMSEDKAKRFIEDIVKAMNTKFEQSRSLTSHKKQADVVKVEHEEAKEKKEERFERLQETIEPFSKHLQYKSKLQQEQLKSQITAKYMESEKQDLKYHLKRNMAFADTARNKPLMWSRLIMEQSGIYKDYEEILNGLIDPKLIFFDERLQIAEVDEFKRRLLPGQFQRSKVRETHAVLKVCEQMEDSSPPLCFYVTNHYSYHDIPGFFSVPYNFAPLELFRQFELLKDGIIQEKTKYEQLHDYYMELNNQLQRRCNITIELSQFKNNNDISAKLLTMQRLSRYQFVSPLQIVVFELDQFKIFCRHYKMDDKITAHTYKNRLFIIGMFIDKHLQDTIKKGGMKLKNYEHFEQPQTNISQSKVEI